MQSTTHPVGGPIRVIADVLDFFRRSGFFLFLLLPKALPLFFIALVGFCLAFKSAKGFFPEILRAAFNRRRWIALRHCENDRFAESFGRVKALRNAKAGI